MLVSPGLHLVNHESKGGIIVELLRRKDGATLTDLTSATGWQSHSVRGFLSAQVGKKMGLKLPICPPGFEKGPGRIQRP